MRLPISQFWLVSVPIYWRFICRIVQPKKLIVLTNDCCVHVYNPGLYVVTSTGKSCILGPRKNYNVFSKTFLSNRNSSTTRRIKAVGPSQGGLGFSLKVPLYRECCDSTRRSNSWWFTWIINSGIFQLSRLLDVDLAYAEYATWAYAMRSTESRINYRNPSTQFATSTQSIR